MKKKVYADYHGPRCTREHDGKVAQWKYFGTAKKSKAEKISVNYNADCVSASGLNDVAALSYPLLGMQSQRDPDYIEYQILTAKMAHIDGFFVEWGFKEHESNEELLMMIKLAQKYDFEIGINWCDAWHFYPWIEKFHPDAITRERKVELFIQNVQYLLDTLYSVETGAKAGNHPLILLFGGGLTVEEFQKIKEASYVLPQGTDAPYFLVRAPITGEEKKGQVCYRLDEDDCTKNADGIFGWIPTRVRNGLKTERFKNWDRYATKEDSISYQDTLMAGIEAIKGKVRINCVNPEMDNRACASWNRHDLSCIPREDGATYEGMWKNLLEHGEDVDIVYIISWNDYTERHQIEPTLTDGYREILTTEKYAAQWKGRERRNTEDFLAPLQLFYLRKKVEKFSAAGVQTGLYRKSLEQIAQNISHRKIKEAVLSLTALEKLFGELEKQIVTAQLLLSQKTGEIVIEKNVIHILSEEALDYMENWAYDAWLSFSYYEESDESFQLYHGEQELCDIKMDGERKWKRIKIPVFQKNILQVTKEPSIHVVGSVEIKEVSIALKLYQYWR